MFFTKAKQKEIIDAMNTSMNSVFEEITKLIESCKADARKDLITAVKGIGEMEEDFNRKHAESNDNIKDLTKKYEKLNKKVNSLEAELKKISQHLEEIKEKDVETLSAITQAVKSLPEMDESEIEPKPNKKLKLEKEVSDEVVDTKKAKRVTKKSKNIN